MERRQATPSLVAGAVRLLGIDEIKRALGDNWPTLATTAMRLTEQVISRHLGPLDTYEQYNNEAFVLTFATGGKLAAEKTTRAIVREITERLAHEAPSARLRVDHTVAELDWSVIEDAERRGSSISDAIADRLSKVREEARNATVAWRQQLLENTTVRFGQVWNPRTHIIAIYRVMLDAETGKQALERIGALANTDELRLAMFDLDCLLLGRAIEALHCLLSSGGKAQLLIPVNFHTLNDKLSRERYLKLCRDVPDGYKKFILFQAHGVVPGTPTSRITEVANTLKAHAHGVVVEVTAQAPMLQDLAATNLLGICISAKNFHCRSLEATQRLSRLVTAARGKGLKLFIDSADTIGFVSAAIEADVDYIDGPGIALPSSEPRSAHRWNPQLA